MTDVLVNTGQGRTLHEYLHMAEQTNILDLCTPGRIRIFRRHHPEFPLGKFKFDDATICRCFCGPFGPVHRIDSFGEVMNFRSVQR